MATLPFPKPKALVFDLMGTCLDWQSSIVSCMLKTNPEFKQEPHSLEKLARSWRLGFFSEIQSRFERGEPEEDIDRTHMRVLERLINERGLDISVNETVKEQWVAAWHVQRPWPETRSALQSLRDEFFLVVLANGTVRLQLDLIRSSDLPFHQLLSSELLQMTKEPHPKMYQKAMELMKLEPSECLMVAAHAYDLRAAKKVGMSTAYIQRTTEDPHEDMERVEADVDLFIPLNPASDGEDTGLALLASMLLSKE